MEPRGGSKRHYHVAEKAIAFVMRGGAGRSAPRVVIRPEFGELTLDYGQNNAKNEGFGLIHIKEKHGKEFLARLPETLAKGDVYKHDSALERESKRYIVLGNDVAVVQRKGKGRSKSWAVTHFDGYGEGWLEKIREESRRVSGQ